MPFTNEEVEQFKAYQGPDRARILALLARLAAAEKAAQFMYISGHPIDEASEEAYQEWKRSTGK